MNLAAQRIAVIVNRDGGGVDGRCEVTLRRILEAAALTKATVLSADASDLTAKLASAADADIVVVMGGDGTVSAAVNALRREGQALIPLPGGTRNVLSRALYGHLPWADILRTILSGPERRIIAGGSIGTRLFVVSAMLGASRQWAAAREAIRRGDIVDCAKLLTEALAHPVDDGLSYRFGPGIEGAAQMVAVHPPPTARAVASGDKLLEGTAMSVRSAAELLRLGFAALAGDWRDDSHLVTGAATRFEISRPGGISGVLDGEPVALPERIVVEFEPCAAVVLTHRSFDHRTA